MKRPTPPHELTEAFRETAFAYFTHHGPEVPGQPLRLYDGGPACWLKQFDPLDRPCSGELEAFHFIGRQRIRNVLRRQLATDPLAADAIDPLDVDGLVELAEWDPRNAGPGCTGHHRRFDNHATPDLKLSAVVLPAPARESAPVTGKGHREYSRSIPRQAVVHPAPGLPLVPIRAVGR